MVPGPVLRGSASRRLHRRLLHWSLTPCQKELCCSCGAFAWLSSTGPRSGLLSCCSSSTTKSLLTQWQRAGELAAMLLPTLLGCEEPPAWLQQLHCQVRLQQEESGQQNSALQRVPSAHHSLGGVPRMPTPGSAGIRSAAEHEMGQRETYTYSKPHSAQSHSDRAELTQAKRVVEVNLF